MRVASKIWLLSFWIIIATPLVASKTTDAARSEEKEESVSNKTLETGNKPLSLLPPPPPIKNISSITPPAGASAPLSSQPPLITPPPLMGPPSGATPPPISTPVSAPISMPPLMGPPAGSPQMPPAPPVVRQSIPITAPATVSMPPLMGPPSGPTPAPSFSTAPAPISTPPVMGPPVGLMPTPSNPPITGSSAPAAPQSPLLTPPPLMGPPSGVTPPPIATSVPAPISMPPLMGPPAGSIPTPPTTTPSRSVTSPSIKDAASQTKQLTGTSGTKPLSPQAEKIADIAAESEDIGEAGLDTERLEQSTGNWLLKRLWWERAEDRYDKIRQVITQIGEIRMTFFAKRTEIDKTVLDPFYLFVGLGQGELREIVGDLIRRIEKDQEEQGDINADERALLSDLRDEKKVLEDLQRNIEQINKLDEEIDLALSRLMEQVNKSREYEQAAWASFKEIANVLSDKKAQELFYNMETAWKNIKEVSKYIQSEFSSHFTTIVDKTKKETAQIRSIIEELRKKGIDFKERADKFEEIDKNKAAAPQQPKAVTPVEDNEDEHEDTSKSSGIMFWINTFINWIWYLITAPYYFITGLF